MNIDSLFIITALEGLSPTVAMQNLKNNNPENLILTSEVDLTFPNILLMEQK